jgi:transcriptional regulator with XRE-family HTH domain
MADGHGPTISRVQLGYELRRARERAGVTRERAADRLECHHSKISKIEIGRSAPSIPEVMVLLTLYGIPEGEETDRILQIAREARKRSARRVPDWVRAFVGFEAEAVEIKKFEIELVPGLLQTEAYIRALSSAGDPTRDPQEVERLVAIRRERQTRLTGDNPPQLEVVMSEAVIRRVAGFGPPVALEQLEHLRAMGDLPTVNLQILPFSAGPHASMGTSFSILRVPEPPDTQVVYLEDLWSADYVDRGPQIAAYVQVFDRLCVSAFDAEGTADMIEEAMGELR